MELIKSMLSSRSKISSTRFIVLCTTFTILGVYIAHNVVAMVRSGGYIDFPVNTVAIMLIVLGAKVGQHVSESKFVTKPEDETAPAPETPAAPVTPVEPSP